MEHQIDLRTLLRLGGLGALGFAVAAGSSGTGGSSATPPSTTTPFTNPPLDPTKPWWLRANDAPFVHDKTSLPVLDARDVAAGPIARVQIPQRVPYGFHAAFVPATPA